MKENLTSWVDGSGDSLGLASGVTLGVKALGFTDSRGRESLPQSDYHVLPPPTPPLVLFAPPDLEASVWDPKIATFGGWYSL